MKIGIIGTGTVGKALGTGFTELGNEVRMGSREDGNDASREWATATGANASVGTFADAAAFGEIVILATGWGGTENAVNMAGKENLAGKVVMDITNPLVFTAAGQPPGACFGDYRLRGRTGAALASRLESGQGL